MDNTYSYYGIFGWTALSAAVIFVLLFVTLRLRRRSRSLAALDRLQHRFSRGKIGPQEYERKRRILEKEQDQEMRTYFLSCLSNDPYRSRIDIVRLNEK